MVDDSKDSNNEGGLKDGLSLVATAVPAIVDKLSVDWGERDSMAGSCGASSSENSLKMALLFLKRQLATIASDNDAGMHVQKVGDHQDLTTFVRRRINVLQIVVQMAYKDAQEVSQGKVGGNQQGKAEKDKG